MKKYLILIGTIFVLVTTIIVISIYHSFDAVVPRATEFKDSYIFFDEQYIGDSNTVVRVVGVEDKNSENVALILLNKTLLGWETQTVSKSVGNQACSVAFTGFRGIVNDYLSADTFVILQIPSTVSLPKLYRPTTFYPVTYLYSEENKEYSFVIIHAQAPLQMNGNNYFDSFGSDDVERWFYANYNVKG